MAENRILIIEDDADLREGLQFSFEGDGLKVTGAGTKEEGLQKIKQGTADLVLLDCNLPDGTGFVVMCGVSAVSRSSC